MGALEFRPPADQAHEVPTAVALADLVLAARLTVRGELVDSQSTHAAMQQLIQVGSSAGGARAKAVVSFNPLTYQIASAFAPYREGFEPWIIKLDGVSGTGMDGHGNHLGDSAPYGRLEFAYYLMATAAGVEMAPCQLLAEGPRRHFMTRRFDRGAGDARIHVLSLAAMANLDPRQVGVHSYDQYLDTVRQLNLDMSSLQQAYRRMVFNVAGVNRDDHTKNFAFIRPQNGSWQLAPAYDLIHTYRPDSRWTARHNLTVNGKTEGILLSDLYAVGERHAVAGYKRIVREVVHTVAEWRTFAAQGELDTVTIDAVESDLHRFALR
jgi:serine/threonine-protein kinase HipA